MSENAFIRTRAISKLLKLRKRIKIVPGGTSAGKTFGILPILIDKAIKTPGLEISVVSESIPHLRRGALKDFEKIMRATNRWIEDNYSRSLLKYRFSNGSYIEFFGSDQPDKLRGARRNILYINEANNVHFEAYQQLAIRTSHEVWLDFNPTNEFWVHTELQDDADAEVLVLTYKDNQALSENIVKEIEKGGTYIKKWFPELYQEMKEFGFPFKPSQIIQPWMFGHGETKATCLWLKGLPLLNPTDVVEGREQSIWKLPPTEDRAKLRSKTFTGIAQAMATQWTKPVKQLILF